MHYSYTKYATKPQPMGTLTNHQWQVTSQQANKKPACAHECMYVCTNVCMQICMHANMCACAHVCMHTCIHKRLGFTLILGLTEWDLCNPKIETLVGTGTNLYCKGQNNSLVCLLVKAQYLGTICIFIPNGNV